MHYFICKIGMAEKRLPWWVYWIDNNYNKQRDKHCLFGVNMCSKSRRFDNWPNIVRSCLLARWGGLGGGGVTGMCEELVLFRQGLPICWPMGGCIMWKLFGPCLNQIHQLKSTQISRSGKVQVTSLGQRAEGEVGVLGYRPLYTSIMLNVSWGLWLGIMKDLCRIRNV